MRRPCYADSLGFLELEAADPIADPNLDLQLVHVTSSHPFPGRSTTPPTTNLVEVNTWHQHFVREIKIQPKLKIVRKRGELRDLKEYETAVVLGCQNPPQDIVAAAWMQSEGIIFTNIAYNRDGAYGSGFYNQSGGLTEKGGKFIRECSRYQRIIDLSHSSAQTARDVMHLVDSEDLDTKVVATHVGMRALYDNPRNLPDDVLDWVVGRGGFVGIPMFMFFLDPEDDSITPFLRHLEHAVGRFGEDAVTIGSDTPYVAKSEAQHKAHFQRLGGELDPESRAKPRELQHPLEYYSPLKMRLVEEHLRRYFPSESLVSKLLGENFWRWCVRNLPL